MNTFLLYIDPGTGSMLFSLFIGIAAAAAFAFRALFIKLKFVFSLGKKSEAPTLSEKRIPFAIFSDDKRYYNIFKPICDEFEKRKTPLIYFTASKDDPVFSANYKFVTGEFLGDGNKAFSRLNFLKADTVISTTPGLDVYQWKRSKDVKRYVHVPHTVDDLAGYRMFGLDFYDIVLTSGKNQVELIRTIEKLRPGIKAKELVTVGSTYLDSMKERFDSLPEKIPNAKKVVLVAPSWGKSGILSKFGSKLLRSLSNTDFKIIVRPHPQSIKSEENILLPLQKEFSAFEWNYDNDNFDVLNKADILITDFSGVIFDFAFIFGKPLLYADTSFDTLPYDADWLDDKIWALKVLPSLGVKLDEKDFCNLQSVITDALKSTKLKEGRINAMKDAWSNVGGSAKAIADYLIDESTKL